MLGTVYLQGKFGHENRHLVRGNRSVAGGEELGHFVGEELKAHLADAVFGDDIEEFLGGAVKVDVGAVSDFLYDHHGRDIVDD